MKPPIFVDNSELFQAIIADLERYDLLALDTELDSYYAYQDKICLVQVSTPEQDYILDPFCIDLAQLAPIFEDPKRTTIFHAGANDIPHLRHEFGLNFTKIFDTYVAAGLLNYPKRGLAPLLEMHFNIILDKKYQRANWRQRPLSNEMLEYARHDTAHLFDLRIKLLKELENHNRLKDAEYAFAHVSKTEYHAKIFNPNGWIKIKGITDIHPKSYGIVKELYIWREKEAIARNQQPFRIMQDSTILRLACAPPSSVQELQDVEHLKYLEKNQNISQTILNTIKKGKRLGAIPWPKLAYKPQKILSKSEQTKLKILKKWRNDVIVRDNIASEFIASSPDLISIVQSLPNTVEELEQMHILPNHIIERYGTEIIEQLKLAK